MIEDRRKKLLKSVLNVFDLELSGLGGEGVLVEVIKVGMEQGLLRRDPLGGVVDKHRLQQVLTNCIKFLHAVLETHRRPIGKCRLKKVHGYKRLSR